MSNRTSFKEIIKYIAAQPTRLRLLWSIIPSLAELLCSISYQNCFFLSSVKETVWLQRRLNHHFLESCGLLDMAAAVGLPRSASSMGESKLTASIPASRQHVQSKQVERAVESDLASAKSPPKLKNDKGKLTEAHGEPPLMIKRNENGFLNRGRMLGEGGFARVYAATDSLNGAAKAVKVISKEQLKSSKTKAKVSVMLSLLT